MSKAVKNYAVAKGMPESCVTQAILDATDLGVRGWAQAEIAGTGSPRAIASGSMLPPIPVAGISGANNPAAATKGAGGGGDKRKGSAAKGSTAHWVSCNCPLL